MRLTPDIIQKAKNLTPIVCLTAYTAPMARLLDPHCDLLLVGDSVAMVVYGMESTRGASMPMMVAHGKAVVTSTQHACIVVDMPYGSYEESDDWALRCAHVLMEKTNAQAVKLEGGVEMAPRIQTLVHHGIPVMGHVGLLPQQITSIDGFKVKGRDEDAAQKIMNDAKAVEQAGAFCVVIEGTVEPLATAITQALSIPTIGIGASVQCDGQILVCDDMLGLTHGHKPKFVKTYTDMSAQISSTVQAYADEVRTRTFPTSAYTYGTAIKKSG